MASKSPRGESFRDVFETIRNHTGVETAFGERIEREGRTVLPVARVAYWLGGGFGDGAEATDEEEWAVEFGGSGWVVAGLRPDPWALLRSPVTKRGSFRLVTTRTVPD